MAKRSYKGWSNKETWLVYVHYEPESIQDVHDAKKDLLDKIAGLTGIVGDFMGISLDEVNWDELEETVMQGSIEYDSD